MNRILHIAIMILFAGCYAVVFEETKLHKANGFTESELNNPLYEDFYLDVEEYTQLLLEKLELCAYPHGGNPLENPLDTENIALRVYESGLSGGGSFTPPNTISLHSEVTRPMSFYGHELVRWVLYNQSSPLWNAYSAGPNSGWNIEPLKCMWNTAETWSLCYVDTGLLGYYPEWCQE